MEILGVMRKRMHCKYIICNNTNYFDSKCIIYIYTQITYNARLKKYLFKISNIKRINKKILFN